jgi:hypothetical protein
VSTLRDDVLPTISDGWQLVEDLGFSQYTVVVRRIAWSGPRVGQGTPTNTDLALSPNPQVQELENGRILRVYGIVPTHTGGGYGLPDLRPTVSATTEFKYVVTGPNGTLLYQLADIDTSDPVEIKLKLVALDRQHPQ